MCKNEFDWCDTKNNLEQVLSQQPYLPSKVKKALDLWRITHHRKRLFDVPLDLPPNLALFDDDGS